MSKPRRKPPTLRTKLAAMLLMLERPYGGTSVPVVPPLVAAGMSADAILSLFDWHHVHPVALGGDNSPMNLRPMLRASHHARFALDMSEIAKAKRGVKKRAKVAAEADRERLREFFSACQPRRTIKVRKSRPMQYTAMKATHKRDLRTGKTVRRKP